MFFFKLWYSISDAELWEECDNYCYDTYIACIYECQSNSCNRECMENWIGNHIKIKKKSKFLLWECSFTCPCDEEGCPLGCENCSSPFCQCKEPENDIYVKQCLNEATARLNDCFGLCGANSTCYDNCSDVFREERKYCPCMENCPMGCSCDGGYKCQPFVTALCQNDPSQTW